MTEFEDPAEAGAAEAGPRPSGAPVPGPASPAATSAEPASPVAAALAELDSLPDRDLAEHPETYQRIHAELQSALATIDNA